MSKKIILIIIVVLVIAIAGISAFFLKDSFKNSGFSKKVSVTPTELKSYTLMEVSNHKDVSSCWTVVDGKVYDVTSWINLHPGGADNILSICGIDGSSAFSTQHAGQGEPASELSSFQIGTLTQ